jgi:CubicO group peptidase (beta-lactamase class C family)
MQTQSLHEQLEKRLLRAIDERVFPGGVVGFVDASGNKTVVSAGYHTYQEEIPVRKDTIYDVASVTKAIPTHTLLVKLIDENRISLEDPVVEYIPEFDTSAKKQTVTIEHLLTYTLDLDVPASRSLKEKEVETALEIFLSARLKNEPGEVFRYTNSTAILIGLVVKRVFDERLDKAAQRVFFDPLGMKSATFHPEDCKKDRIAPTEQDEWRDGLVHGVVHDESTYMLQNSDYYLGAAGLFSTAPDLLTFLEMLLNDGRYHNDAYFSESIIEKMFNIQFTDDDHKVGLGWELDAKRYMGESATTATFGKTGFTGCMVLGDVKLGCGLVFVSNRVYPKRPADSDMINEVRQDIGDMVWRYNK